MKLHELFDVRDLVVAITGGAGGIGRGIAEGFADNGAKIVLMDVDSGKLDAAIAALTPICDISGEIVDVTAPQSVGAAYESILRRHGRIDVVFANAGISNAPGFLALEGARTETGVIETIDPAKWNAVLATNLTGVMLTLQGAVPAMKRQGGGSIIVTTSIAPLMNSPAAQTAYVAAKAGAAQLVRQTAFELAKFNIRVNAIAPGPFVTGITRPGAAEIYAKLVPMRRVPEAREIQGLALFLASRASTFVTGAEIPIDGGARFGAGD